MSILKPVSAKNLLDVLDDEVLLEARLFIDMTVRPEFCRLLASNADKFGQVEVLREIRQYMQGIGDLIKQHLSRLQPTSDQLAQIESSFSEMLFPHADKKRWALLLQPLLIRHFVVWRQLAILDTPDSSFLPESVFLNFPFVRSHFNRPQLKELCTEMCLLFELLCSSPFNANIADSGVLAYDSLARGYAKGFYEGTGEILLDERFIQDEDEGRQTLHMKEVLSLLHSWLISVGLSEADAQVVADEAAAHVKKGVIDILLENIYTLTIVEFPLRMRSLKTLCSYMSETKQHGREALTNKLIDQLKERLLKTDVDTKEILEAYAKCVESLKVVDPSNVLMLIVCDVIKDYLQKRPDTIRQIITYITCQENRSEMEKNWGSEKVAMVNEKDVDGYNDEFLHKEFDTSERMKKWYPDPLDAPKESARIRQSSDMFNMLVQIYGSKMKFLDEYQRLMAERIINNPFTDRDEDFENGCLRSLSMRFSPEEIKRCEVMLRDLEQSRIMDQNYADRSSSISIAAKIISHRYWPAINAEEMKHLGNEELEKALAEYSEIYSSIKNARYIEWIRAKGTIEMTFDLGDGVEITKPVPTTHAQIIFQFQEKEEWTSEEISEKLNMSREQAESKLEWWVNKGMLVKKLPSLYALDEDSSRLAQFVAEKTFTYEEDDTEGGQSDDQGDSIDRVFDDFWKYIRQLVEQTGGQNSADLFKKIKMMVPESSIEQFSIYMTRKVATDQIRIEDGVFKIIK